MIHPEALAYAETQGLRDVLEQLIERVKSIAPELRRIDVSRQSSPDDPTSDPQIVIEGVEDLLAGQSSGVGHLAEFDSWVLATFPPEVWSQFVVLVYPGV